MGHFFLGVILVVYLGHGIFRQVYVNSSFVCLQTSFCLREVLRSQMEKTQKKKKKWCASTVARVCSDPFVQVLWTYCTYRLSEELCRFVVQSRRTQLFLGLRDWKKKAKKGVPPAGEEEG